MLHFYYLAFVMKARLFILRCAAFLLILVFSQKAGTGLFLHNLLHTQKIIDQHPDKEDQKNKDLSYACGCIDDFFMPFDETQIKICTDPVLPVANPVIYFRESILFQTPLYSSLRGPPADWL